MRPDHCGCDPKPYTIKRWVMGPPACNNINCPRFYSLNVNLFAAWRWFLFMFVVVAYMLAGCATPSEILSVVEQDRVDRQEQDRQAVFERLRPILAETVDALEDYKGDNADTTGRAIERVQHEAQEARQGMKAATARHEAQTATERATDRRDAQSRSHALGLRLDRHEAQQAGTMASLRLDAKVVGVVATTAGVTARANRERLASLSDRVEAEDSQDQGDKAELVALLTAHRAAVAGLVDRMERERTKRDDARAARIEAGIWSTVQRFGTLSILIAGAAVGAWRLLKGKRGT